MEALNKRMQVLDWKFLSLGFNQRLLDAYVYSSCLEVIIAGNSRLKVQYLIYLSARSPPPPPRKRRTLVNLRAH